MKGIPRKRPKPEPLTVPLIASREMEAVLRRVASRPSDRWRMPPRRKQ